MPALNYRSLKESSTYLAHIGRDIWLMDDHRWACVVWEEYRSPERDVLLHADYHWDGVYDFFDDDAGEKVMLALDAVGLRKLVRQNRCIRFDSFIAPAVRRGLFEEVHFFCKEDDGNEIGLDAKVLNASNVKQYIHNTSESLASIQLTRPLVFDLCLDLFARAAGSEPGDIWSEEEVREFLTKTTPLVKSAKVVTISLSFGYSGTEEETRSLAELVIPYLIAARCAA